MTTETEFFIFKRPWFKINDQVNGNYIVRGVENGKN